MRTHHRFADAAASDRPRVDPRTRHLAIELLCNTFPTGAMVLDAQGKPLFANREAAELLARWSPKRHDVIPSEILQACERLRWSQVNARTRFGARILLRHPKQPHLSAVVALERSRRDRRIAAFCVLIQDRLKDSLVGGRRDMLALLTVAERRVAKLVAEGLRNSEIAATLGKSVTTVKSQLSAIFGKLQVESRTQLATLLRSP